MHKAAQATILAIATFAMTLPASAEKLKGPSTLKDFQPFGTTDKEHKHQAYDLSFEAKGKAYTCRTDSKKSINATDFVVGSQINYEIDNNKGNNQDPAKQKSRMQDRPRREHGRHSLTQTSAGRLPFLHPDHLILRKKNLAHPPKTRLSSSSSSYWSPSRSSSPTSTSVGANSPRAALNNEAK